MSSTREGVNPLRPYYIPPSIGEPSDLVSAPVGNSTTSYSHRARDIFADIDYTDYISEPSPSNVQSAKDVVDDLLWRYTSVLMAQPFEVARTLLQIHGQEKDAAGGPAASEPEATQPNDPVYDSAFRNPFADDDDDADEPNYFAPYGPNSSGALYAPTQKHKAPSPTPARPPPGPLALSPAHQLVLQQQDSILEAISQLWQKEGAWGVWKGSNTSFLYTVLQSLFENWSRSLLSALFNVPDLGLKDDVDRLIDIASPYPWASLFVAASAAVATALILSPLDLVRTRLIITPTSRQPRRAISILRSLPSYVCEQALVIPTALHSLIYPLLTLSAPLVLRSRFAIDRDANPVTFSIAKFCSSTFALFVKLPVETVLRRGQASVLTSSTYVQALEPAVKAKDVEKATTMDTVVPLGKYNGVFGTMHHIVYEEGGRDVATTKGKSHAKKGKTRVAETVYRRGQGMEGLWRGWKVSWWGLVGLWTAAAVSGGGDGRF